MELFLPGTGLHKPVSAPVFGPFLCPAKLAKAVPKQAAKIAKMDISIQKALTLLLSWEIHNASLFTPWAAS